MFQSLGVSLFTQQHLDPPVEVFPKVTGGAHGHTWALLSGPKKHQTWRVIAVASDPGSLSSPKGGRKKPGVARGEGGMVPSIFLTISAHQPACLRARVKTNAGHTWAVRTEMKPLKSSSGSRVESPTGQSDLILLELITYKNIQNHYSSLLNEGSLDFPG